MLSSREVFLSSQRNTSEFAKKIAAILSTPFVIALQGDIGTGKTTFVRALLQALNIKENIKSPTFSIVETYVLPDLNCEFHHFDLYRFQEGSSLASLGFSDYFTSKNICCIEWPERADDLPDSIDLLIIFTWLPKGRSVLIKAQSLKAQRLLDKLET